jgi:DNA ligase-1
MVYAVRASMYVLLPSVLFGSIGRENLNGNKDVLAPRYVSAATQRRAHPFASTLTNESLLLLLNCRRINYITLFIMPGQSKLNSFFTAKAVTKENISKSNAPNDQDEDDVVAVKAAVLSQKPRKRKYVIDDESSDEEMQLEDKESSASKDQSQMIASSKGDEEDAAVKLVVDHDATVSDDGKAQVINEASSENPESIVPNDKKTTAMTKASTGSKKTKQVAAAAKKAKPRTLVATVSSKTTASAPNYMKKTASSTARVAETASSTTKSPAQTPFTIAAKQSAPKKVAAVSINSKAAASSKTLPSSAEQAATPVIQVGPPSALSKELSNVDSDKTLATRIDWTGPMPYKTLCDALALIEETSSRLAIQVCLTKLLRSILLTRTAKDDLLTVLYLASNSVAPAFDCVELGIGDAILIKAISEATGSSSAQIKARYQKEGDLGSVASQAKNQQRTLGGFFASNAVKKVLSAKEVLTVFRQIASTKGNSSQKQKVDSIKKLLVVATQLETKYIIRGLQGKLRIGLAQTTVLVALAHSLALTVPQTVKEETSDKNKNDGDLTPDCVKQYLNKQVTPEKRLEGAVNIMKQAYSEVPSYEAILDAGLQDPLEQLYLKCTLTPGIPVVPMLAKPTTSIQEVLKRLNGLRFTCEYKYDGERAQVHLLPNGKTRVFSRNLLDTSEKYPEVPLFVKEACKNVTSFVLDSEVVAFNTKTGQLVPFQILSTRKKTEESAESAKVQVIVEAFDLMYLNGESLLQKTLTERRKLMHEHFEAVPGKFRFAEFLDAEENGDTTIIEDFLENAVKNQCEGLMVKTLDVNAIYEPSRRSLNWLKLKKDYLQGLGDSIDLVPIGAYYGRGKRTGVYGAYLLACYDADNEEFQSVCKIGTGFSDEDLKSLADTLNKHTIPTKSSQFQVSDQLECDVWFDSVQVWEVKAADLSKSSAHRGALGKTGEEGRGIGLRFPRFERLRDDKRPENATSSEQILEMYYAQDSILVGEDDELDDDGI